MKWFYNALDKTLSAILITMVIGMVVCISGEIVLSAIFQPIAANIVRHLTPAGVEPTGFAATVSSMTDAAARFSAPLSTLSESFMVWVGILGSALAFRERAHLGVDALVRIYPPKVRLALDILSTLLVAAFAATVLVMGGWRLYSSAQGSTMPGLEFMQQSWFFSVLMISGVLTLIYAFYHLVHPVAVQPEQPTVEEVRKETIS